MTHAHFAWATAKMVWQTSTVIRPRSKLEAASVERLTAKKKVHAIKSSAVYLFLPSSQGPILPENIG